MTHGNGHRRRCPECGQSVEHMRDHLPNRELRGPRQITSSNVDRIFDNGGERFLMIEEKGPDERIGKGQEILLRNLAGIPAVDVWGVRGTPRNLTITKILPDSQCPIVQGGDFDCYQDFVSKWFQFRTSPPPPAPDWDASLAALASMPVTAPKWCPSEAWSALDKALADVMPYRAVPS